uniref:Uncharacterized protein n=1 Tax=Zea mays TaxID=4577 RepID=B4FMN9_MAIZE|nr:unknown [Zea mays]
MRILSRNGHAFIGTTPVIKKLVLLARTERKP